ncbi:hypothetical protein Tco_1427733 [Tanacetum coccineum]
MSADSAVTYTFCSLRHDFLGIPMRILMVCCRQLLSRHHVLLSKHLEDHVQYTFGGLRILEDFVPAEDEAPAPLLPPFFLSLRIRPPHTRAAIKQMRAAAPSTYHSLLPSGTPPLPRGCEVGESYAAAATRHPGSTIKTRLRDTERRMMTALELVNRRVTYQVDVCTRESPSLRTRHSRFQKGSCSCESLRLRALEARVTILETEVHRYEWQRQATDDLAVEHIMCTQALEAGARIDTLEDTQNWHQTRKAHEVKPRYNSPTSHRPYYHHFGHQCPTSGLVDDEAVHFVFRPHVLYDLNWEIALPREPGVTAGRGRLAPENVELSYKARCRSLQPKLQVLLCYVTGCFLKRLPKLKRYVGGMPTDYQVSLHRAKTMQEAIEMANCMMDQEKNNTFAERQQKTRGSLKATPRYNQNNNNKRQNTGRGLDAAGNG